MATIDMFTGETSEPKKVSVDNVQIDWLSWTLHLPDSITTSDEMWAWLSRLIEPSMSIGSYEKYFSGAKWIEAPKRAPYSNAVRNEEHGIVAFFGGQSHVLIEIQGKGCSLLETDGELLRIATHFVDSVSRLDLAIDFSGMSIGEFVESMSNGRFKSSAHMKSESGETAYIGARKSDRYTRVYMYNEPHPRANEPRCEFVMRKHYAKQAVRYWAQYGKMDLAQMCNNTYKFEALPEMSKMTEKLPSIKRDKSNDKRVHWLIKQVAPAVQKLLREGEIDVKFIAEYFIPDEYQKQLFDLTKVERGDYVKPEN